MIEQNAIKKIRLIIILIIFLSLLGYALFNIYIWFRDNQKSNKIMENIYQMDLISEDENEQDSIVVQNEEEIYDNDIYWNFIKMPLIDVNLNNLLSINDDTIGWLKLSGTNINYPFVQTKDNTFYLNHDFYKQSNRGGWVFLDYRNDSNLDDVNNIIYAHGRANGTMFGSLKNILSNDWLNNPENYTVLVSSAKQNTLWQVFSVYKILNTNDYIKTSFNSSEEINDFLQMLIKRSSFNFKTTVNENDKILTLSTCYNVNVKVVLHAKLIKKSL